MQFLLYEFNMPYWCKSVNMPYWICEFHMPCLWNTLNMPCLLNTHAHMLSWTSSMPHMPYSVFQVGAACV